MQFQNSDDIICALATPNGSGALAIIRLSGKKSIDLTNGVFSKKLIDKESHSIHFGTIADDSGEIIDEVLVSLFKEGKSFTGEESVEISCHASPYIIQQLLKLFQQKGARAAEPGEFTLRAFLNGKMDLSQAEAVADLIASQSKLAHKVALNQLRGGFSSELKDLREKLINFASLIELELDFAEEDVEFADRTQLNDLVTEVLGKIKLLIESFELGNVIKTGIPIVFAGRPNAGKSTILNALIKEERAIVSDIAGTTRDTIEEKFNINGIDFRLIDTAGLRETTDVIENLGIERSMEKIKSASLVVYLYDAAESSIDSVLEDIQLYLQESNFILVGTKNDLPSDNKEEVKIQLRVITEKPVYLLTAKNTEEAENLKQIIYEHTVGNKIENYSTIVTNARHIAYLEKAQESLNSAHLALQNGTSADWIAMDIRQAMYAVGSILGQISEDDLLANIFSKFCIGK